MNFMPYHSLCLTSTTLTEHSHARGLSCFREIHETGDLSSSWALSLQRKVQTLQLAFVVHCKSTAAFFLSSFLSALHRLFVQSPKGDSPFPSFAVSSCFRYLECSSQSASQASVSMKPSGLDELCQPLPHTFSERVLLPWLDVCVLCAINHVLLPCHNLGLLILLWQSIFSCILFFPQSCVSQSFHDEVFLFKMTS